MKKALVIIFGGTGDLAQRKLYPSIFQLYKKGLSKRKFRSHWNCPAPVDWWILPEVVKDSIDGMYDEQTVATEFASHFYYQSHNVTDTNHYKTLQA